VGDGDDNVRETLLKSLVVSEILCENVA